MPDILSVGSRIELSIHDLAFGGAGVGRYEEFVVFVPFVCVGERVVVELVELKKSFAKARLVRVLDASPDRVEPMCEYYGTCGGCQYQHIAYPVQLRAKHKQIADLMQRIGGFDGAVVRPVVPCPSPYSYRNRIMVRTQWSKELNRMKLGFLEDESRFVVDMDHCRITEPALNDELKRLRENPPPKSGVKAVLRVPPEDWDLPNDSFFQNNFQLLPGLVGAVRDAFKAGGSRCLIDAYCGVGFFSIELADLCERFAGIEIDAMAVRSAKKNAADRNITNGEYLLGPAETLLPQVVGTFNAAETTIVLDPPRVGCAPSAIELLRQTLPRQVIYVSCHPATLARDLKTLCEGGLFRLESVMPLDMFPQTQHVECVADIRRVS